MNDLVVAVDVGTSKVSCIAAGVDKKGQVEALSLAYSPVNGMDRGSVVDAEAVALTVNSVIGKVERHLGIQAREIYCGVGGLHVSSMTGQGIQPLVPGNRAVKRQDVHQVLGHSRQIPLPANREQIIAVPREYVLDGQRGIQDPVGLRGSRLEVKTHIVTGASDAIDRLEKVLSDSGSRRVMGMIPTSMASGLGLLSAHAAELGAVVIDIGAGKTDVAIFADGVLAYQGVVKIGADHFSHDICQLLKTDFIEAERLKSEFGSVVPGEIEAEDMVLVTQEGVEAQRSMKRPMLAEILESRAKELFSFVGGKLEESGLLGSTKQLVITGGGSQLVGMDLVATELLPFSQAKLQSPKVSGKFAKQVASPNLSTVVGIARYAMETGEDDLAPVSGFSNWKDRISTLKKSIGLGSKS